MACRGALLAALVDVLLQLPMHLGGLLGRGRTQRQMADRAPAAALTALHATPNAVQDFAGDWAGARRTKGQSQPPVMAGLHFLGRC